MRTLRAKTLLVTGGVLLLGAIAATVSFFLLLDVNRFRPSIESTISDATGLEVRIRGKMKLSFFPFGVAARDIHVAGTKGDIVSVESLRLAADLLPLARKRLKVTRCVLVKPAVTIEREVDGTYNFERPERRPATGGPGVAFSLDRLTLSGGGLVYLDRKTGERSTLEDFNLAVSDLSVAGNALQTASFTGSADCREMQHKDVRVGNVRATVRAAMGRLTIEPCTVGSLVYRDRKTGERTELKEITLSLRDMSVAALGGDILRNAAFTGDIGCRELRKQNLVIGDINSPFAAAKGVFHLKPVTMEIFGTKGGGEARLETSGAEPRYAINLQVAHLDVEKLEHSFGLKRVVGGRGDLSADMTLTPAKNRPLLSGLNGTLSLRGDHLVIYTMDLDKLLSKYETSQEFNLVDLGAFFVAGPLSILAVRGYRSGDLYRQTLGGQGVITRFNSHWTIRNGVAEARDCALATPHYRLAMKGRLDLVGNRYDNVTVALLDDKGCATFRQSISGTFHNPRIDGPGVAGSFVGPIATLFRKTKRLVLGTCEVFYQGSVQPPSQ